MHGRTMRMGATGAAAVVGALSLAGAASAAPAPASQPAIEGAVRFHEPLRCVNGAWTGDPVSFRYEWLRSGSPFAEGERIFFDDTYTMGGYTLSCRVTATDAAGATGTATSVAQQPGQGRTVMRLTEVKPLPKGRVRIRGTIAPRAAVTAPYGRDDSVVVRQPVGRNTVMQLSLPAKVDARGRFTVVAHSTSRGRKTIRVDYSPGNTRSWATASVTRRVAFTVGGTSPFGGGSVRVNAR